jgi:hypothetical protein
MTWSTSEQMVRQLHVSGGYRFRVKSVFFDQLQRVPRQPLHIHAPLLDKQEFLRREDLPNVTFLGPRDDVPAILKEHTACVFFSKVENIWITTLIETIRANRLCLLNTVGKTGEVFTDGENALLCGSVDEAVEKLLLVKQGSVDAGMLSQNALKLIKEYGFDSETIAAAHVELADHLF